MIFENQTHEYHYTNPNPASSNNVTDTLNPPSLAREQEISKQILGSQLNSKFDLKLQRKQLQTILSNHLMHHQSHIFQNQHHYPTNALLILHPNYQ